MKSFSNLIEWDFLLNRFSVFCLSIAILTNSHFFSSFEFWICYLAKQWWVNRECKNLKINFCTLETMRMKRSGAKWSCDNVLECFCKIYSVRSYYDNRQIRSYHNGKRRKKNNIFFPIELKAEVSFTWMMEKFWKVFVVVVAWIGNHWLNSVELTEIALIKFAIRFNIGIWLAFSELELYFNEFSWWK